MSGRAKIYIFFCSSQTGSGTHQAFCSVGADGSFSGLSWPESETKRSSPYSDEFKNVWRNTFTLLYASMSRCLNER